MIVTLDGGLKAALLFAAMARSLTGTLVSVESGPPARLVVRAEQQFQTFVLSPDAEIERDSTFEAGNGKRVTRIDAEDLTPGEHVDLSIDADGQVTHGKAVARIERAKVASAAGPEIVLEDGTKLTIGSILRFVDADGTPSPAANLKPGDGVLLFRHPLTRNIYRVDAETHRKTPCSDRND